MAIIAKGKRRALAAGVLSALGMIAYFLVMRALNLHLIIELRYFNIVFIFAAIFYTLHQWKKIYGNVPYLQGLLAGMITTVTNVIVFDVFMVAYLVLIDPGFMQFIVEHAPFGHYMDPWRIAETIFTEGLSSGGLLVFILMQYFKSNTNDTL